jgi:DNA replication protein DnaD
MDITQKDIDWKSFLIKKYLSYDLDETDVMVIFVSESILEMQPKTLLTCDILTSYMKARKEDIDQSLTKLISHQYLKIVSEGGSIFSSFEDFKTRLYEDFVKDLLLHNREANAAKPDSDTIYGRLEELSGHMLSPIERDMVASWLREGASEGMVYEACQKSLTKSGNISFKSADRLVLEMERASDRKDIGVSTVNEETKKKADLSDAFASSWNPHDPK